MISSLLYILLVCDIDFTTQYAILSGVVEMGQCSLAHSPLNKQMHMSAIKYSNFPNEEYHSS